MTKPKSSSTPRAAAFSTRVLMLAPGECVAQVRAVDQTMTVARLPEEMPALRQQLRNAVTPAVARAREATGNTYTIEVGDVQMPSGMLYAVAVVTRTND